MTNLAKALAFAQHCLKWEGAMRVEYSTGPVICDGQSAPEFGLDSATDLARVLQEFLGKRYFIQINRGTSSLFHWRVIVGLQDKSRKGAPLQDAQAEGEDLWDAVFDACVAAEALTKPASSEPPLKP